jgi:hypothetical protein
VLTLVLALALVLGVVVVVGSVVVVVVVVRAVLLVGAITRADVLVVVIGVSRVVSGGLLPENSSANPYMKSPTTTAPNAPNATSATGLRNQGTGSPGWGP